MKIRQYLIEQQYRTAFGASKPAVANQPFIWTTGCRSMLLRKFFFGGGVVPSVWRWQCQGEREAHLVSQVSVVDTLFHAFHAFAWSWHSVISSCFSLDTHAKRCKSSDGRWNNSTVLITKECSLHELYTGQYTTAYVLIVLHTISSRVGCEGKVWREGATDVCQGRQRFQVLGRLQG